jgi:predicted DNA binding CopG/RHH family protein
MIVFQPNINKPTQELCEQALKGMMEHPANIELVDNYRQMKRQMAEAEARQAVEEFVKEVVATDDYKKALAAELKKDERRKNKRVPTSDLERVKWYIGQKKTSLPAIIPTITHFAESADRWGRVGLWRVQAYGYLSGLDVVDGDHVLNPEARIEEWLQREDFKDLGIVCIFVTPSGEGIKVLFKAREEWGNLIDNSYQMADILGILEYCDSQTKNSDHAHFIPKMSDVKYIDWEELFTYENPAYEARYGEAYRRGESEPTKPRWQELERQRKEARKGATSTASTQSTNTAQPQVETPVEFSEEDEAFIKVLNEYYGPSLPPHTKHDRMQTETSHWLCYYYDNDPQKAIAIAKRLDWVKEWNPVPGEVEDLCQSAAKKKLLTRYPKALKELMDKAGINLEQSAVVANNVNPLAILPFERWCDTIESFFDVYPCLREVCEPHPRRLWPFLLFASAAMMGTCMDLTYYYFYANRGERTRLNYIIWGVGDPTSGKHTLERLMDNLLAPIIAEGELADDSTNTWKSETDAKGANKEKDLRPEIYNRMFGYRTSNSEFIRSLINCKEEVDGEMMGRHMVTVSSEKDLEIGKTGSWISKSNMILLSFHGEYDDQHYSNKQSVSGRYRVFWNMVETFTPPTLTKLVNERSVNSGLDTRTGTIPMGEEDFKMMPLGEKDDPKTAEYNKTLLQWSYKLDQRRGELPLWPLVEHVHKWCDDHRAIAEFNDRDKADWLLVKRCPYYGINISAPYIDMRHWEEREQTGTYTIDAQDLAFCDLVLDIQYRTQHYWYYELHRQYYDNQLRDAAKQRRRTNKFVECFRQLPEEFTTEKFAQVFGYANNRSGQKTLERLLDDKAIERTMRGNYKKLVSEL